MKPGWGEGAVLPHGAPGGLQGQRGTEEVGHGLPLHWQCQPGGGLPRSYRAWPEYRGCFPLENTGALGLGLCYGVGLTQPLFPRFLPRLSNPTLGAALGFRGSLARADPA